MERDTAILECVVASDDIKGSWFKNGEPVEENNRIHISSEETMRNLVIEHLSSKDSGEYSFRFGTAKTSAMLNVEGMNIFLRRSVMILLVPEKREIIFRYLTITQCHMVLSTFLVKLY